MSIISKKNFLTDDINEVKEPYELPKLVTTKPEVISIKKSFMISTLLHPAVVFLIWIIVIALSLMGIKLFQFNKLKPQVKRDIEFVLVDKPGTPKNPNTKYRSDMNSRTGGVNDPTRKVSMPSPTPKKQSKPAAPAAQSKPVQKQQPARQVQKPVSKPAQQPAAQKPAVTQPTQTKPAPPTARPSAKPISAPTPVAKPSTPFAAPVPKAAPTGKTLSTGPIGGSTTSSAASKPSSTSTGSGSYAPRPSLSPSMSGGGSSSSLSRSSSSGTGNVGNPGGGGGAPGIDALREPDFGPYMRELQRKIKLNWDPPKGNESKTVILLFKIAKDGRLLSCKVNKSSGLPSADQAALKAVELTAPFRPLPADFKGQSIDIQFTFDYRVFGASRY